MHIKLELDTEDLFKKEIGWDEIGYAFKTHPCLKCGTQFDGILTDHNQEQYYEPYCPNCRKAIAKLIAAAA